MSAFKRRPPPASAAAATSTSTAAGQGQGHKHKSKEQSHQRLPAGTRPSPAGASILTSTGHAALDDVLGGGLPLTCVLATLAPDDAHAAYGALLLRHFAAQALAVGGTGTGAGTTQRRGHRLVVLGARARAFVEGCMWMPGPSVAAAAVDKGRDDGADGEDEGGGGGKVTIAWRYAHMKRVQTTVQSAPADEEYCRTLDLTCRVPRAVVDDAERAGRLVCLEMEAGSDETVRGALARLRDVLANDDDEEVVTRICVPNLGGPEWGDVQSTDVLWFMHALRGLVRAHPRTCASVVLAPHASDERWGGAGYVSKLAWLADGAMTLRTLSGEGTGTYHGVVRLHRLPSAHTLVPPSDRFSELRGLGAGAGGENNLGFRCTRRRFVLETMALDVEGGVGERRTAPVEVAVEERREEKGRAAVEVEVEGGGQGEKEQRPKAKKRVGFAAERRDVYEF